jgi:hypothetical protein
MFCVVTTISAVQQKAQTVLWYANFESIIQVHCEFGCECGVRLPDDKSMQVREGGSVENRTSTGQPARSDEGVDRVRQASVWSLEKLIT